MPGQLPLDLPVRAAAGRSDFLVAPSNARALAVVDGWRDWPQGKLALIGPKGSGKSHLARVWAAASGARVIAAADLGPGAPDPGPVAVEDVAAVAGSDAGERALLHLHNLVLAEGGRLLLTGRTPPAQWGLRLPDLASRLVAVPVARIEPPDDALLAALIVKLFADRGLAVGPRLVAWLVPRMERSHAAAAQVVAALDRAALASGRPLGRGLAREVLERMRAAGPDAKPDAGSDAALDEPPGIGA
jgi:chromosomal replication initiation ATPase DnaA